MGGNRRSKFEVEGLEIVAMMSVTDRWCALEYRLRDFNEWGQCQILDLLTRYSPSNEEEVFDMLVSCVHRQYMYIIDMYTCTCIHMCIQFTCTLYVHVCDKTQILNKGKATQYSKVPRQPFSIHMHACVYIYSRNYYHTPSYSIPGVMCTL